MTPPLAAPRAPGVGERRDDIQGMRALAVLAVVAYHAGVPLPGGFTGPDIFFAVSGFVITGMLLREWLSTGRISFSRFYLRRARRLLPALAIVSVATLALAAIVISPIGEQQQVTARAVRAATTITANLYFLRETGGYFQPLAQENPFLHTWTLSVEEQFYVAFPITLFGLWWAERRWRVRGSGATILLSLGCLGSLGLCVALSYRHVFTVWPRLAAHLVLLDPVRVAFFSPVTRAWEFLAGVLLAVAAKRWRPGPFVRGGAGVAGLTVLALTFAMARSTESFPGALAMLPVIGTAGLLIAGLGTPASFATRLLAMKPLVWIGDRSYSWYLWHWPLIVFARALFPYRPSVLFAAAVVSLVPAALSFRFVEEPTRRRHVAPSASAAVRIAAVGFAAPLACAVAFTAAADRSWGEPDLAQIRRAVVPEHLDMTRSCAAMAPLDDPARARCVWTTAPSRGTMLLIGDSNAGHFSEPFIAAAHALNYDAQLTTIGGCPFLRRPAYQSESCRHFVEGSLAAIARRETAYAGIVISNATFGYLNGIGAVQFAADASPGAPITRQTEVAGWVASVRRTIEAIGHRSPVIVVGAVPQFYQVPQCLRPTLFSGPSPGCGVWTRQFAASWRTDVIAEERAAARSLGALYLDAGARLCREGGGCSAFIDGMLVYRDGAHLSVEGAMMFEGAFRSTLAAATRPQP